MGLIQAGLGTLNGVLADQWKEFFTCDSLDKEVLIKKGQKVISGRSSNTKGNDNVISNGSGIAVADGQCMIIVEQGKVVEVCAEPGEFTYRTDLEPSIFAGKFGDSLKATFKELGKRFTYGGDPGKDQRVYYINTKELLDNKFGTPSPIPFRVVDKRAGVDIDVSLRCSGIYTYRVADPIIFYTNIAANVTDEYRRDELDTTLKTEFISALAPAFGAISEQEIRPNQITTHNAELCAAMKQQLSSQWRDGRGLEVVNVSIGTADITEEDKLILQQYQRAAVNFDPLRAAANTITASQDALRGASTNTAGAATGFMGMGMAANASGMAGVNVSELYAIGMQQNQQAAGGAQPAAGGWKCACGNTCTGNFCTNCGAKKPDDGWKCSCGSVNKGNFCTNCGSKRPAGAPLYKCDKCGYEPEDPHNPPKFCPECGDPFDQNDIQ